MSSLHDFDFLLLGPWTVANDRLGEEGWQQFDARCEVDTLPGGGHVERLSIPAFPGVGGVEAFTLRLFEPETGLWRIWWSSSVRPGHLDSPMLGHFEDGVGTFFGEDLDPAIALRFRWTTPPEGPRWEQSRSRDAGETWIVDWTMQLTAA